MALLVADHVIPKAAGGEDRTENMVVSCFRCNAFKHDYDPSGGQFKSPPSDDSRRELIKDARREIPANGVMAILLGALMIHGLQPGPLLIKQAPDVFWGSSPACTSATRCSWC